MDVHEREPTIDYPPRLIVRFSAAVICVAALYVEIAHDLLHIPEMIKCTT